MSEGNGNTAESWRERLEMLEKSHVRLMTDHEIFQREQDEEWKRQRERWSQQEKRDAARDERMDVLTGRIDKLVSAIGALVGKMK